MSLQANHDSECQNGPMQWMIDWIKVYQIAGKIGIAFLVGKNSLTCMSYIRNIWRRITKSPGGNLFDSNTNLMKH